MSEDNIETYSSEELEAMRLEGKGQTDWERVKNITDEDIDVSDDPVLEDSFWDKAELVIPEVKERITIRIDRAVLEFFQRQGPGYQTRMNAVLKAYVEAMQRKTAPGNVSEP